ncbi:MAG TPA: DNA adenine methylase [Candidatus Methylacidiphilales bacterium]|nr:DNA adenine methylase [Candidatus Methylacidiphilales bacterium]
MTAIKFPPRGRPVVRWPGGKTCLLKKLLPLIPKHSCYVEPFAGGLAVLLAKPRSSVEVINDTHGDLINFYRCVRFHCEALLAEIEFVPNSRREFHDFRAQPGLTDLQRAARWFIRNKIGFGGRDDCIGVSVSHGLPSRQNRIEAIRRLNLRLDQVTIENLDWQRCLTIYDRPATFFFLDPPYLGHDVANYQAWKEADAEALRQRLDQIEGKWLLTLNDCKAVRTIFKGCSVTPVTRSRGINNKAGYVGYAELIIRPK